MESGGRRVSLRRSGKWREKGVVERSGKWREKAVVEEKWKVEGEGCR